MSKDIVFDNESRRRMQIGINKLADAVGVTLGPRGELSRLLCGYRGVAGQLQAIQAKSTGSLNCLEGKATVPAFHLNHLAKHQQKVMIAWLCPGQYCLDMTASHLLEWVCKGVMNASFLLQEGMLSWSSHTDRHRSSTMACQLHVQLSLKTLLRTQEHS